MKLYYLHLIYNDHHVVEVIHDVSNDDAARGLATMIQVLAPLMDAVLEEMIGLLPKDRKWRVDSVEISSKGRRYQPKDTPAAEFGLGNK